MSQKSDHRTAADLIAADLYRHTDPDEAARDRAEHDTDLWVVTSPFTLTAPCDPTDPDTADEDKDAAHLLHAYPAGRPEDGGPQYLTSPADTIDLLARLLDASAGRSAHTYTLTRTYRLPPHTVQVQIRRNDYAFQSHAAASLLTADGWSLLLADPPDRWHRQTATSPTDIQEHLDPLATHLLSRAHRVLTIT
ncbi:hypothetical protein [Parafrankia elaeagni]|uniref:hypothetical protein n=1 Tax=Parafrankia elaeagni TaxID=222534 RepID=UPI00036DAB60|nr:hypothetical protein [Parafrankia elaeagni]